MSDLDRVETIQPAYTVTAQMRRDLANGVDRGVVVAYAKAHLEALRRLPRETPDREGAIFCTVRFLQDQKAYSPPIRAVRK